MNYEELRAKYPKFIYKDYKVEDGENRIIITFEFEIEGLASFSPRIEFLKKDFKLNDINSTVAKNIIFHLGMVEAISYFKATCSPQFCIKCGKIDEYQEAWYRKLFYLGLGEFRYRNNIDISEEDFIHFNSEGEEIAVQHEDIELDGIIIPVGGGKDSNVTLDLLSGYKEKVSPYRIGMNDVARECIYKAGYLDDNIIEIVRIIDKRLLELNAEGFLNGHTPFSAIVAFTSYLSAYLTGKKYIALSNEDSANESNVDGVNINHQYSKTIEFENDFREFTSKYFKTGIEYFSFLRPITELQIAMLFSRIEKYHKIFKSCNVGSKQKPWIWCCNCPKCLFVYSILSPFLYKDRLVEIFGEDMFNNQELLPTFIELCGYGDVKPFECVGTYEEIRWAITKTIENMGERPLPFLLDYYKKNFEMYHADLLKYYNEKNNLPKEFDELLRKNIF